MGNMFADRLRDPNWATHNPMSIRLKGADEIDKLERNLRDIEKSRTDDIPRLIQFRNWIIRKLGLAEDATDSDVYGRMHVMESHAHGYEKYIVAYKCDDKQGEIARQSVRIGELADKLAAIRKQLEEIVCTDGCDKGVVMLDVQGTTHYDAEAKCQVYDHEYFSPLGDALIELYDLTTPLPKQEGCGWNDIEIAPKDGTWIELLLADRYSTRLAHWAGEPPLDGWYWEKEVGTAKGGCPMLIEIQPIAWRQAT